MLSIGASCASRIQNRKSCKVALTFVGRGGGIGCSNCPGKVKTQRVCRLQYAMGGRSHLRGTISRCSMSVVHAQSSKADLQPVSLSGRVVSLHLHSREPGG